MTDQSTDRDSIFYFLKQHPDLDILHHDFLAAERGEAPPAQPPADGATTDILSELPDDFRAGLKAYQRLLRVHDSQSVAQALLEKGYDSAHKIASVDERVFVDDARALLGGQDELARHIHASARALRNRITHIWAGLHTLKPGGAFSGTRGFQLAGDTLDAIQKLPSYADMFGSQDFCTCEHCKSIFGPAAYFVDIMRITDTCITPVNAGTIPKGWTLIDRRPDLFSLELSCSSTNDTFPYILLVNQALEAQIAAITGSRDVEYDLARAVYPFGTPFNFRLGKLRAVLGSLSLSLAGFYATTAGYPSADADAVARETLGLSPEQAGFVTTARAADTAGLEASWGVAAGGLAGLGDLATFTRQSGLSRAEVTTLTVQNLDADEIAAGLAHGFLFNASLPAGQSVQADYPDTGPATLSNLTDAVLDMLDRFVRLSAWTGIGYQDLDTALSGLGLTDISAAGLKQLASAAIAVRASGRSWAQATSFWADMPTTGRGTGQDPADLFDTVWNRADLRGDGKVYRPTHAANPLFKDTVVDWNRAEGTTSDTGFGPARLLAGLGVNATDLGYLADAAFGTTDTIPLTVDNLSRLYRAALLAHDSGIGAKNLAEVAAWLGIDLGAPVPADAVVRLLGFKGWAAEFGMTTAQIGVYTGDRAAKPVLKYTDMKALWVQAAPALFEPRQMISDSIDASRADALYTQLLALEPAVLVDVSQAYATLILSAAPAPMALVPAPVTAEQIGRIGGLSPREADEIAAALNAANDKQATLLDTTLADAHGVTPDLVAAAGSLIAAQPGAKAWIAALLVPVARKSAEWTALAAVLAELKRMLVLSDAAGVPGPVLAAIGIDPRPFGVDLGMLFGVATLSAIGSYTALRRAFAVDDEALLAYLALPGDTACAGGAKSAALSAMTGWPQAEICAVLAALSAGPDAIDTTAGLTALSRVFILLQKGGFGAGAYAQFLGLRGLSLLGPDAGTAWESYAKAADTAEGTAAATLGEIGWANALADFRPALLEGLRNLLVADVLWLFATHKPEIASTNDLSGYLLIDVLKGGGFETSLVVEATGAVQMYMSRCRSNIEPGIARLPVPEIWWDWISNYRNWEANRKVFLYPQNYLDPTLRTSRTGLFKKLEQDLSQTNITRETVTGVYRDYVGSLSSLSSLVFVDGYRTTVMDKDRGEIDTLFAFARTATEPYVYYWCKQEREGAWSQWNQIDVTIKSPFVTPIYAFGRLFVFWVEQNVVTNTNIEPTNSGAQSRNSANFHATMRFSFVDSSGRWTTDQTLFSDSVIYSAPSSIKLSAQSGYDIFNVDALFWQKCNVLAFSGDAPIGPGSSVRVDEKIAILYGPFLENTSNGTLLAGIDYPDISDPQNPDRVVFELDVYNRAQIVNQAIGSSFKGLVGLREPIVLNRELNRDYLFQRVEFLNFLNNHATGVPPTLRPVYDYARNTFFADATLNPFRTNYYGDWQNKIESAPAASPVTKDTLVFTGVNTTVATQMINDLEANGIIEETATKGVYRVYTPFSNNTDFSFLLFEQDDRDSRIARAYAKSRILAASIAGATVDVITFEMTALTAALATTALGELQAARYVDAKGNVAPDFSSASDLAGILAAEPLHQSVEYAIRAILFLAMGAPRLLGPLQNRKFSAFVVKNQPSHMVANVGRESYLITPATTRGPGLDATSRVVVLPSRQKVTKDSFITSDISPAESAGVFSALVSHNVIAADGTVIGKIGSDMDLSYLFAGDPDQTRAIKTAQVRVVLVDLPKMTTVTYFAEDDSVIITEHSFEVLGITSSEAKQAFDTLSARGVIGANGLITPDYDPATALKDLFPDLPAEKAEVLTADVGRILQGYYDATWKRDIHDLRFDFTRLTTGAVPKLSAALTAGGIDALLALPQQQAPVVPEVPFYAYVPGPRVDQPEFSDATQVDFSGVYGIYFWELFFFGPRLIADTLTKAGGFQDALSWIHYIFNPTIRYTSLSADSFVTPLVDPDQAEAAFTALRSHGVITADDQVSPDYSRATDLSYLFPDVSDPLERLPMVESVRAVLFNNQTAALTGQLWRFQPFRNHTLESLVETLSDPRQIATYNSDPYDPYAIAQLRIGAFEEATFGSYVSTLMDWGDSFFQLKTREYLNSAFLLYTMASDLLGPRPEAVKPCSDQLPVTYAEIKAQYSGSSANIPQFLIDMENLVALPAAGEAPALSDGIVNDVHALFCVPQNEQLLALWTRVEDRLFKIRNSLDLDGNPLTLPLFAPPIDPMALVRAAAASGSSAGFAELATRPPVPQTYRFMTLVTNARGAVGSMQYVGSELEQALMGQSAEAFTILTTQNEQALYEAQLAAYDDRRTAARASVAAMTASRAVAEQRRSYYDGLIQVGLLPAEVLSILVGITGRVFSFAATGFETGAAIAALAPQAGSPFAMTYGGKQIETSLHRSAGTLQQFAQVADAVKELLDVSAQFQRQKQEWEQQRTEAENDIVQIDHQIEMAVADLAAAEADYKAHVVSIDNARSQLDYLKNKFDNPDYYAWRVSRAAALYYQSYQLAMQSVEAAQSALQWELGTTEAYLTSDPWDPARRGLMAANTLNLVLDRMEYVFSQKDIKRQEVTTQIRLSQLDPAQLDRLRNEGLADIVLPERLFDYHFPSHFCRRIKTVTITLLPADEYAFEEISATLTQTGNKILMEPTEAGLQFMLDGSGSPGGAVWQDWRSNQKTAISKRYNDQGNFVEYFGDGDKLERFEGTGAVSNWRFALPKATNQFDFSTIADLVVNMRYTALDGGDTYARMVEQALAGETYTAALMLDMATGYENAWGKFLADTQSASAQTLKFRLDPGLFPPHTKSLTVGTVFLSLSVADTVTMPVSAKFLTLNAASQAPQAVATQGSSGSVAFDKVPKDDISGAWTIAFDLTAMAQDKDLKALLDDTGHIDGSMLSNMFVSIQFTASVF